MKKEYIYLGAAALLIYLWNKKKNSASAVNNNTAPNLPQTNKFTYTIPQIQSWDNETLSDVKAEIVANPSIYADPQTYLSAINAELFKRGASAVTTAPPSSTTSKPLPASNTGVVNPTSSTAVSTSVSTSSLPPTSTLPTGPIIYTKK